MDKNQDFSQGFPYMGYETFGQMEQNFPPFYPMPSPYEQGYQYYRYLTQQMEYKIKCKEYEKLGGKDRRVE